MRKLTVVLVAAVLLSAPSFAQTSQAANPVTNSASDSRTSMAQPTGQTATAPGDPSLDEVVCKNEPPPTGSRIGGKRVCKTNREWMQDEDAMNRARGLNANTDFSHGGGGGLGGSVSGMGH